MSRAQGKHGTGRSVEVTAPESAEGRDIGLSDRQLGTPSPIPGGEKHLVNHQTMRQAVPEVEPRPEFRGVMTHGVPPEKHTAHERAASMRGPDSTHDPKPHYAEKKVPIPPVPVIVVSTGNDIRSLRSSSDRRYTLPAAGSEPVRLVGANSHRVEILLLNEDPSHHIRFSKFIASLQSPHNGAVLPATSSSYLKLTTQDELYGISDDSGTPTISIIEVFDSPNSEVQ